MVDGMYVRDGFSGGLGTEVANSAVEELQLISGNFNAEYGNAMSGVLNLVTQEGGSRTSFRVRGFTDAIFGTPSRDYTFAERDTLILKNGILETPNWGTYQGQFSLGGPLPGFGNRVKYFLSGEYLQTDGYIGKLQNEFARRSTAKLTFSPSRNFKVTLTGNLNSEDLEIYQHEFAHQGLYFRRLVRAPGDTLVIDNNFDGNDRISTRTIQGVINLTHTLSSNAFYEFKLQRFSREFYDRVSDNILAYALNPPNFNPGEDFLIRGFEPRFIDQEDRVLQAKLDFTYQANVNHNLKAGLDFARHRIWRHQLLPTGEITTNLRFDQYKVYPIELAFYAQDKMEFKDLVINIGVRVDYFEARDSVVVDRNRPLGPRKIADSKVTFSPRLGLAHPITDRANLHFSYGHFYQVPEYDKIIFNSERSLSVAEATFGNPDLEPQKTIAFEVGWDQQITDFLALTLTGFYKDIENLVSTDFYQSARPSSVTYYVNQDFANSRGVEINLRTRRYNHFASYFSYTLSRVEGNSSNPLDRRRALFDRPPRVPLKQLITLEWDRPHVFNFNLDFRYQKGEGPLIGGSHWLENFGVNLTGRFQSGLPYTPTDSRRQPIADENVAREPSTWQLDLRVDKLFDFSGLKLGIFAEITNLTNHRNIVAVFTDTGLPNDTNQGDFTPQGKRDPYNIGPQRNIRLGLELNY
jgi:outer membrane receptor protein involved in Fe transport